MPDESLPQAIPPDYDRDPDRLRLARSVLRRHALAPDVHERVARRFVAEGRTPVLDVGCGEGELPDPAVALAEARRALQPGGLVAVAAPSRHDSPELAHALPPAPLTFDAELAPELLAQLFTEVEVERWDAPLVELPTRAAVRDYLIGKGVEPGAAESTAKTAAVPLSVSKRGGLAFARKT